MRKSWEPWAAIAFLIVCLVAGLVLAELYAPGPILGVVRFEGLIDSSSAEQMVAVLDAARQDRRVVAVVLEIASPGGDAGSSEKLYHAILQLRQKKPVVVAIDGIATSGAYYVAVAGDKIYATASANIGNVGAWIVQPSDPRIFPHVLATGPYKLTGGARFDAVRQLELTKEAFLDSIVRQRSQSPYNPLKVEARTLAEAHIYLGSEGLALGLIDAQGGRSDAIVAAAELAGIKDYQVVKLDGYLGLPFEPSRDVEVLLNSALPGTVFLLDSRMALTGDLGGKAPRYPLPEVKAPGWNQSKLTAPPGSTGGSN